MRSFLNFLFQVLTSIWTFKFSAFFTSHVVLSLIAKHDQVLKQIILVIVKRFSYILLQASNANTNFSSSLKQVSFTPTLCDFCYTRSRPECFHWCCASGSGQERGCMCTSEAYLLLAVGQYLVTSACWECETGLTFITSHCWEDTVLNPRSFIFLNIQWQHSWISLQFCVCPLLLHSDPHYHFPSFFDSLFK